jgi:4-amino-4-deoxy-L-arabinose transferase-like glycosyltransferase
MKEDAALVLGLSAFFLALTVFWRSHSAKSAFLLGVACATAASAKYIGIVVLPFALAALLFARPKQQIGGRKPALRKFAIGFLIAAAVLNYSFVLAPAKLFKGIHFEAGHVAGLEEKHFATPMTSTIYLRTLLDQTTVPVLVLAAGHILAVLLWWRRRSPPERLLALFPIGYFLMLTVTPLKIPRYLLPVVVLAYYHAGMGIAELITPIPFGKAIRTTAALTVLGVTLVPQAIQCTAYLREFTNDSRTRLLHYVERTLPETAVIAQDQYASLPDLNIPEQTGALQRLLRQKIVSRKYVVDLGTVDELRQAGFTHVVVCEYSYGRFFGQDRLFQSPDAQELFELRKQRYEELFRRGVLLWENRRSLATRRTPDAIPHIYINPVLRLYELP